MLINKNLIVLNLEVSDKSDAILKLATLAQNEGKVTSCEEFLKCVLEREETYPTAVGNGVAIPHGKSSSVKEAMIVFARLKKGILWDATEEEIVDTIFLLGIPEESADDFHIRLLAQLSRKIVKEDFINQLREAKELQEVFNALSDIQVK